MVLVDTCVWVEHFRGDEPRMRVLLGGSLVLMHPFILGELACGNLRKRKEILANLWALPAAVCASDQETLRLIEERRLAGRGIGWVDAHLLASALLTNCHLWTLDERLNHAADAAGVKRARHLPTA